MSKLNVTVNNKLKTKIDVKDNATQQEVEAAVMSNLVISQWINGVRPKKIVYVPNKSVNIVI